MSIQTHKLTTRALQRGFTYAQSELAQPQNRWVIPAVVTTLALLIVQAVHPSAALSLSIVLFLLGVPHGAVERNYKPLKFQMPTIAYTALYLVFGILVFSSWLISPLGTFILFLLLSAWHFGASEPAIKSIGVWVIIGSCLIYPVETLSAFGFLIDVDLSSETLVSAVRVLAFACAAALLIEYLWKTLRGQPTQGLRLIYLIGLFLILPPIPAVAVYFFAFHGLGEFARTLKAVGSTGSELKPMDVLRLYGPATFPAMFGAVVILIWTVQGHLPIAYAAGLGVAFIIPHMLPVEALLRVDREDN